MKRALLGLAVIVLVTATVSAQPIIIDHEPWLNWELFTPVDATDVHLVVDNPDFQPREVFEDAQRSWRFDGVISTGNDAILSWVADDPNAGDAGSPVHIGADMTGAGRIIGAYWTYWGQTVAPIPIVWELTRIIDPDPLNPANDVEVWMRLQTGEQYAPTGQEVRLRNIRTYLDIPADVLGLADLNAGLDETRITAEWGGRAGMAYPDVSDLLPSAPDSFFDVFVGVTLPEKSSPEFESLLVADIMVSEAGGVNAQTFGWFWNLNPQCPEPGSMALLALGGLVALRRRRRK